jgi:hypothetical protein
VAQQAQDYYAMRDKYYTEDIRALQAAYYAIPEAEKAQRRALLLAAGDVGTRLKAWWEMKNEWMDAHPEVKAATAVPEGTVFEENIDPAEERLIGLYLFDARPLTAALRRKLTDAWKAKGEPGTFDAWLMEVLAYNQQIEPDNPAFMPPVAQR